MTAILRVTTVAALLLAPACVGPDLDYGETATFEIDEAELGPYRIAAGDQLQIMFAYHQQLNLQLNVRPDGMVSMPFAEEILAAGKTVEELDTDLQSEVGKHLRDPELAIVVTNYSRQRIYVAGEVRRPGEVTLIPGMSLQQAIAKTGWFLPGAADDSVVIIRALGPGKRVATKIDCSEEALIAYDQELQPFDMVYVPKTTIARISEWVDEYLNKPVPQWFKSFGVAVAIRETANN